MRGKHLVGKEKFPKLEWLSLSYLASYMYVVQDLLEIIAHDDGPLLPGIIPVHAVQDLLEIIAHDDGPRLPGIIHVVQDLLEIIAHGDSPLLPGIIHVVVQSRTSLRSSLMMMVPLLPGIIHVVQDLLEIIAHDDGPPPTWHHTCCPGPP